MKKRLLSLLLAMTMLASTLPLAAFAESAGAAQPPLEMATPEEGAPEATPAPEVTPAPEAGSEEGEADPAPADLVKVFSAPQTYAAAAALRLGYRENGAPYMDDDTGNIISTANNLYLTRPAGVTPDDEGNYTGYTFELTKPDETTVTLPSVDAKPASSGSVLYWSNKRLDEAGTYTVTVKKAEEEIASGSFKLVAITFYTEDKGEFETEAGDRKTYTGYVMVDSLSRLVFANIPKVNVTAGDGSTFLGWSDQQDQKDYTNIVDFFYNKFKETLAGDAPPAIDVYAVYGTPRVKALEIQYEDKKVASTTETPSPDNPIDLGAVTVGYKGEIEKTLTILNTGNTNNTISQSQKNGDWYKRDLAENGIKLAAGRTTTLTITIQNGLGAGTYTGDFLLSTSSGYFPLFIKFQVKASEAVLKVIPEAATKTYGQILDGSSIGYTLQKGEDPLEGVTLAELGLSLYSPGFLEKADAGSYDYQLQGVLRPGTFASVTLDKTNKVTVSPATPQGDVNASPVTVGSTLSKSQLSGSFTNPENGESVPGALTWDEVEAGTDPVVGDTAGPSPDEHAWTFTPENTTNYKPFQGKTYIELTEKKQTVISHAAEHTFTYTYSGVGYGMRYTANRPGAIEVKYLREGETEWKTEAPRNAGTYDVRASMEETEEYAAATHTDKIVIKQAVANIYYSVKPGVYNGSTQVPAENLTVWPGTVYGPDANKLRAVAHAEYNSADAGLRNVTITVERLEGDAAGNYRLASNTYHTTTTIAPKELGKVRTVDSLEKPYGVELALDASQFTAEGLVEGETLPAEFISEGEPAAADTGSYDITVNLTSGNYTLADTTVDGQLTVTKVKPVLREQVTAGRALKGDPLKNVTLNGEFINPNNPDMVVEGVLDWKNPEQKLGDGDTDTVTWRFTLSEEAAKNYEQPDDGKVTISLVSKEPVGITAHPMTVDYNGQGQALEVTTEPADVLTEVRYRRHVEVAAMALDLNAEEDWSDWTTALPVDAGTYDVDVAAYAGKYSDRADNQVYSLLTISPIAPTVPEAAKQQEVARGTVAGSVVLPRPTGLDGTEVAGSYAWTSAETPVEDDGTELLWTFLSDDPNYTNVSGSTTFTLADDPRTIAAVVYNLPDSLGATDYAVLDVEKSGLKAGDRVTFFNDPEGENAESETVIISEADVQAGRREVALDIDALDDNDGVIYARITSSKKNAPTKLFYRPEAGFTLSDDGGGTDAYISVHPRVPTTVTVLPNSYDYTIVSVDYALVNGGNIVTLEKPAGSKELTCKLHGGTEPGTGAMLTVSVTYAHPDPAKADLDSENFTLTLTIAVACMGTVDTEVVQGPDVPAVKAPDIETLEQSVLTTEDQKQIEEQGAKIVITLDVANADTTVTESDKAKVEALLDKELSADYAVGQYLDITLSKTIDDTSPTPVSQTNKPFPIQVAIPDALKAQAAAGRITGFAIVRVHKGEATLLKDTDSDPDTITFYTDRFSTYAIVYRAAVGNLVVSNEVAGTAADAGQSFTFTVTLDDTAINGKYGDLEFKNGQAVFELKGGDSVAALALPAGVRYTVTQAAVDGYTTTMNGATGTITDGQTQGAAFTNTRNAAPTPTPTAPPTPTPTTPPAPTVTPTTPPVPTTPPAPPTAAPAPAATPRVDEHPEIGAALANGTWGKADGAAAPARTAQPAPAATARPAVVPATADDSHPGLWLALLAVSAVALCTGGIYLYRRRKQK